LGQRKSKGFSTSDARWHCAYCTTTFTRKYDLERHVRTRHTHEKPYKCGVCGKAFTRQDVCKRCNHNQLRRPRRSNKREESRKQLLHHHHQQQHQQQALHESIPQEQQKPQRQQYHLQLQLHHRFPKTGPTDPQSIPVLSTDDFQFPSPNSPKSQASSTTHQQHPSLPSYHHHHHHQEMHQQHQHLERPNDFHLPTPTHNLSNQRGLELPKSKILAHHINSASSAYHHTPPPSPPSRPADVAHHDPSTSSSHRMTTATSYPSSTHSDNISTSSSPAPIPTPTPSPSSNYGHHKLPMPHRSNQDRSSLPCLPPISVIKEELNQNYQHYAYPPSRTPPPPLRHPPLHYDHPADKQSSFNLFKGYVSEGLQAGYRHRKRTLDTVSIPVIPIREDDKKEVPLSNCLSSILTLLTSESSSTTKIH